MKILDNEDGQVISLDFVTAAVIFMVAFSFVYYGLSDATSSYVSESTKIYPVVDRLSEILVKDPGYWENGGSGTDWEDEWAISPSSVKRIGFANSSFEHNILNSSKVDALMVSSTVDGSTWWDFGDGVTKIPGTYEDAAKAFGIKGDKNGSVVGYDIYMQVRPINISSTAEATADANVGSNVPISSSGDIILIERIAYMEAAGEDYYIIMLWVW
ncbi:MAG: hypothetical protein SVM80_07755 [Halobacteriota archaeon]|nr:hypothetical protein [Halobacteriota archaeon]